MHRCALFDLPCRVTSLDYVIIPGHGWRSVLKPVHLCGTLNCCGYSRQPVKCSPKVSSLACLWSGASDIHRTVFAGALSCRQVKCLPAYCTSNPALQSGLKLVNRGALLGIRTSRTGHQWESRLEGTNGSLWKSTQSLVSAACGKQRVCLSVPALSPTSILPLPPATA